MIEITNKEMCCGCTACVNACPLNCIEMREDPEGFRYPYVDKNACIDCKKCENVCPVKSNSISNNMPAAFLARTKDAALLKRCTSGGVFTGISQEFLEHGGIVYGVVYDEHFVVRHDRISKTSDIYKLPGSKYVQSELGNTFSLVKNDVLEGKRVVFCGTPCQVAGLVNYMGKRYENLLLVDLVCHGVPSPKLWKKYVSYLENKHGKLEFANFRSKRLGYHVSVMEERFESGKVQFGSARTNLMSKIFFRNAADRPICYTCPFKTVSRCSDLTIFDGWHASQYVDGLIDDDEGYTIILVQSQIGMKYLENIENMELHEIDVNRAIELDGKMAVNSVKRPESRDGFYELLDEVGIEKTVARLFPITTKDYMVEHIKVLLKRIGILKIVKKLKA